MSTLVVFALIVLLIDSILLIYATAKKNWKLFAICVAIGGLMDVLIVHYGHAA